MKGKPSYGTRKAIQQFSGDSQRRCRDLVRNTIEIWRAMVTLTYPGSWPTNGPALKQDINAFTQWLRRRKIRYVWVLEFQERGAPHFHLLIDGWVSKSELSKAWFRIVGSGDVRHLAVGTQVKGIDENTDKLAWYLSKYLGKDSQKNVPDGFKDVGRFWGATRGLIKLVSEKSGGLFRTISRELRPLRRWQKAHWRSIGLRWRYAGSGMRIRDAAHVWKEMQARGVVRLPEPPDEIPITAAQNLDLALDAISCAEALAYANVNAPERRGS